MHWSRYIELILNGCCLKDHLAKTISLGDLGYKMWEQDDSLIHAWLLGSKAGERFKKFMFLKIADDIRDHAHKSSSTRGIDWHVYCLVTCATNLGQGNRIAKAYATDPMTIWIEINHYRLI